jgi:hypothetical protein
MTKPAKPLHQLEDDLKAAEMRVAEMRAERDEAYELVEQVREQIEQRREQTAQWKEAFQMEQDENGEWGCAIVQRYDAKCVEYADLLKDWNRFVPEYNAAIKPRQIGRPLNASVAQCAEVLKLHKARTSLRDIADDTNLSLRTVRTIIGRSDRTDRTTVKRLQRLIPDRAAANTEKALKRARDTLLKDIAPLDAETEAVLKEIKGLGKRL